ncbi:hypothetical protein CsSME_00026301 [Camellia sinensis var. sinensis]
MTGNFCECSATELYFIDALQRLGVAYHFESAIEATSQRVYDHYDDKASNDLYIVALSFRLLRQHGYPISCGRVHGEDVLDEALAFTTTHLESAVPNLSNHLQEQVIHALNQPIHHSLTRKILFRVTALTSIIDDIYDVYGTLEEHVLFTDAVERWEISALDQLPEYMNLCYQMAKQGRSYCVDYAKSMLCQLLGTKGIIHTRVWRDGTKPLACLTSLRHEIRYKGSFLSLVQDVPERPGHVRELAQNPFCSLNYYSSDSNVTVLSLISQSAM